MKLEWHGIEAELTTNKDGNPVLIHDGEHHVCGDTIALPGDKWIGADEFVTYATLTGSAKNDPEAEKLVNAFIANGPTVKPYL